MTDELAPEYGPECAPERPEPVKARLAPPAAVTKAEVDAIVAQAVAEAMRGALPAVVDALASRVRTMPELRGPQGIKGDQGQAVVAGGGGSAVRVSGAPINDLAAGTNVTLTVSGGTATIAASGGNAATPTIAEVLAAGNTISGGQVIQGTQGANSGGLGATLQLGDGREADPGDDGRGGIANLTGGNAFGVGVAASGGWANVFGGQGWTGAASTNGGGFFAQPGTDAAAGQVQITSNDTNGANGQALLSDGTYAAWHTVVTTAGSTPVGGGFVSVLVADTTGKVLYGWTGSDYTKIGDWA